ncbi:hypothetical protein LSH36_11g04001 [Paralvinella palmiformis]|uniref:Uncharacterized protein n=1 Tax=Paralvinella palmiformis TaxID=53620 RepID=A0AAD9NI18_9ANNE|nr:hypothetical protein LSH36_11g04001 [Paralvinella palmiformis]
MKHPSDIDRLGFEPRPDNNKRPSSETSLPANKDHSAVLCPRCFRPLSANFSNFDSAPFHEHSYLLMCRNMGKREEMERIAAKFGIRGSTFQPSTRPNKSTILHPGGSYFGYSNARSLTRQPRSMDSALKRQSGRVYIREASTLATNRQDDGRRTNNQVGHPKNGRSTDAGGEIAVASNPEGYPEHKGNQPVTGRKCTCTSGYVYDKTDFADRTGLCSGHFCDFSHASPVPVYISPKFMMQNPRERKKVNSRRHLSPAGDQADNVKRPLSVTRHKKVPPINSQAGAVYINKDAGTVQDNKKSSTISVNKTTMDIYLPQLCMSQDSDEESVC